MKNNYLVLLILVLLAGVASASAQKQYTILGKAPDTYNDRYVYMYQLNIDNPINASPVYSDSAIIKNGKFVFKGILENDSLLYLISMGKTSGSFIALDTTELRAEYVGLDPLRYFRVSGTKLNEQLTKMIEYPMENMQKYSDMRKKRGELLDKNEWTMENEAEFESMLEKTNTNLMDFVSNFVKDNIDNPVGQYILVLFGGKINKDVMDEIEPKLSEHVKQRMEANEKVYAEMGKMIQIADSIPELVKPGNKYIDFEAESLSGDKVKLSSVIKLKKLVLLDFWASWCGPCLKEMPEIANLYEKYKDKGLQIVGISLDKNRTEWKYKIKDKNMVWFQYIDSNVSNPVKNIYGVKAIPRTVLIDENGIIIANKLHGKELEEKIEMLLSE